MSHRPRTSPVLDKIERGRVKTSHDECKFGIGCRNFSCKFQHPFSKCRFDSTGEGCNNARCKYWHPIRNSAEHRKSMPKELVKPKDHDDLTEVEKLRKEVAELKRTVEELKPSGLAPPTSFNSTKRKLFSIG